MKIYCKMVVHVTFVFFSEMSCFFSVGLYLNSKTHDYVVTFFQRSSLFCQLVNLIFLTFKDISVSDQDTNFADDNRNSALLCMCFTYFFQRKNWCVWPQEFVCKYQSGIFYKQKNLVFKNNYVRPPPHCNKVLQNFESLRIKMATLEGGGPNSEKMAAQFVCDP